DLAKVSANFHAFRQYFIPDVCDRNTKTSTIKDQGTSRDLQRIGLIRELEAYSGIRARKELAFFISDNYQHLRGTKGRINRLGCRFDGCGENLVRMPRNCELSSAANRNGSYVGLRHVDVKPQFACICQHKQGRPSGTA